MFNNEFFDVYLADMNEHLGMLNESLLKLDKSYTDKEIINTIFRSFHTMKGSTAAMGYSHSAEIIHKMEDLLQEVREERIKIDSGMVTFLFRCHDFVEAFIQKVSTTGNEEGIDCPEILEQLKIYINGQVSSGNKTYEISVNISEDCVFKTVRAWMIFNEVEQIGEIISSFPKQPSKEEFEDKTYEFESNNIKVVVASEMESEAISTYLNKVLLEVDTIEVKDYKVDDTNDIVNSIIESESFSASNKHESENNDNVDVNVEKSKNSKSPANLNIKPQSFIRVSESKVDNLVDMLGELLIIQSLHKQEVIDMMTESNKADNKLLNNIVRMERITKDIQTISMSLRMVSLKQSFQKLERIGHDTALELDKKIDIVIIGEDTEIDRSIVEKIQDPLMHLVRNSISHGIESEEVRLEKGKPTQGKVSINAYNKRGFVYIEITDDGKGLNIEKLYEKALEKNLIDSEKTYTDEEILRFIYLPGFSTQEAINNISGRGVGMNVVETEIKSIGGKIEIANEMGVGCTFILKIPINLATINGTIVDVFGGKYVIPTLQIKQLLKPELSQWVKFKGKTDMIKIRDEIMPIIPIDKIFGNVNNGIDYNECMIIVVELDQKLKAIPVSSVIGKQEIVVKPLGPEFRGLDFVSGATILGDGKVSLILDIEALFKEV